MRKSNTILIIDDNQDDVLITKRGILKFRTDVNVEAAGDGEQAMEFLRKELPPALIILDMKLQETAGEEILQFIRNSEQTKYIPVIILSTSILDRDLKSAYLAGANSFLHKTHDFEGFMVMLQTAIHYWLDLNNAPD